MAESAERHYCEVWITALAVRSHTELNVNVDATDQSGTFSENASMWDKALKIVKKHTKHQLPLYFVVRYTASRWELLPPRCEFAQFSAIETLHLYHYPHLTHIDVTALPFLRQFGWFSIRRGIWSNERQAKTLKSIRITGLTQCKYLEVLCLEGMSRDPFILKLKAPFRNLQALEVLNVSSRCVNQHYPLELVASQSLRRFTYNGEEMLRYFKALRGIVQSVCAVIHQRQQKHGGDIPALAKALLQGPIHDPSLLIDIVSVITRTQGEKDCLRMRIDALM